MKNIEKLILTKIMVLIFAAVTCGQSEADLKAYFEGRKVEVKIDMPATKDGINVYPDRTQPIDFARYGDLVKEFGVSVRDGERILITKIKVKDKHIEFQLGGGGYGTFGDDTTGYVYVPTVSKSRREKNLEKQIKDETDERRRRRMREELDYLRRERESENSRNRAEAATAEELARRRIQEKRLQGGSRFNIRFDRKLNSRDLMPEAVMEALAEYVEFIDLP